METNTSFPAVFVILAEVNSLANSLKELRLDYVPPGNIGAQPSVRVVNSVEASLSKYIPVRAILFKEIQAMLH